MYRSSPRIKTSLPVRLSSKLAETEMIITDLGIDGAFLRGLPSPQPAEVSPDGPVTLHFKVSGKSRFEQRGTVIRKGDGGLAVNFSDLDNAVRKQLWGFIADNLSGVGECPYCGQKFGHVPETCKDCGWELNFRSPGYFKYYEKMCLLKKVYAKISELDTEQLHKVLELVFAGPAGVEPAEEDQEFVGTGKAMLDLFANIRKVAPTDLTVLILGESGTGKEMTAKAIHERSSRKDRPFVAINCGAIPDTLLESELFGYEKGAFTGAYASKKGKFEHADGGTIFLDEIGEMPFALQVKLLRFLQDKNVERVGAVGGRTVDVRLIAATNRDLCSAIAEGKFRNDLYYRLDEFTIHLPPLRERGDDKLVLARFFLNKFSREMGMAKTFSKEAVEAITAYGWPGNVREIINKIRRALVMSGGNSITPSDLDLDHSARSEALGNDRLSDVVAQLELEKIQEVLNSHGHNISKAASVLGITRQTLHRRLKMYGIR